MRVPSIVPTCVRPTGRGRSLEAHDGCGIGALSSRPEGKPSVLAVAHTPGAGERARQLLGQFPNAHVVRPPPGIRGMVSAGRQVLTSRAKVLYLVDIGKTTAPAAVLGRLMGKRVIVDTGDACFALARSLGDRNFVGLLIVGLAEQLALRSANEIVVRGRAHAAHVPRRATYIPDLPPEGARPVPAAELCSALDLDGTFVVGIVGSLIFSPHHRVSYGWDLIEALAYTDPEVVALIVGDGSGLEPLRTRAHELGVTDRCRFVGRVPAERVHEYVNAMNAAISTQTNDIVGQVRTTAKLPLYLACGCPVLASHVGEAAILLGDLGWTLPYNGVVDREYPRRLANVIESWRLSPADQPSRRTAALGLAREAFDPQEMQERLANVISRAVQTAS